MNASENFLPALSRAKLVTMPGVFFLCCFPTLVLLTTDWFPTSSEACVKVDDLTCAAFKCGDWKGLLKAVLVVQGNATNAALKYHRKLLFGQTRGLQKAQLGLAVRTAVRAGDGQPWDLANTQTRGAT